ncbi:MAG: Zn-ribbon domain-containing OB-fold protein [Acidimicrobiales bacterium]
MPPPRLLPALDDTNRPYWTGGRDGCLLIERCAICDRWQHPPEGRCAACGGEVVATPVSGRGTVFTYTVNAHQFHPEVPPPYVIAIVTLDEQADLRVVTNIVDCDEATLRVGLPVRVSFEEHGERAVPVFVPAT